MDNTDLTFPYRYTHLPQIGKVFIPLISLQLKTHKGLVSFNFLVDTGADLTTIPKFVAEQMDIDFSHLQTSTAEGIGGFQVKTWLTTIDLYPPSRNTPGVSPRMKAKDISLRRDFAPDEAQGEDTPTVRSRELHFGSRVIKVRASITDENSTPPLLGRVDLLDHLFSWDFNSLQKKIFFKPVVR